MACTFFLVAFQALSFFWKVQNVIIKLNPTKNGKVSPVPVEGLQIWWAIRNRRPFEGKCFISGIAKIFNSYVYNKRAFPPYPTLFCRLWVKTDSLSLKSRLLFFLYCSFPSFQKKMLKKVLPGQPFPHFYLDVHLRWLLWTLWDQFEAPCYICSKVLH